MTNTPMSTVGINMKRLPDKQCRFIVAYALYLDGTKAALAAGYSKKSAHVMACKLLKKPLIARAIGNLLRKQREKFEVDSIKILKHLVACATRDGRQAVDKNGIIVGSLTILEDGKKKSGTTLHDLPDDVGKSIDDIYQEVKRTTYDDGSMVEIVKTKIKLVSKAAALDMAARHKGLFEPEKVQVELGQSWDQLLEKANQQTSDPLEDIIDVEVQKRLPSPKGKK